MTPLWAHIRHKEVAETEGSCNKTMKWKNQDDWGHQERGRSPRDYEIVTTRPRRRNIISLNKDHVLELEQRDSVEDKNVAPKAFLPVNAIKMRNLKWRYVERNETRKEK